MTARARDIRRASAFKYPLIDHEHTHAYKEINRKFGESMVGEAVGLIVISFETKKGQEEILDEAIKYFRDGVGLEVTERGFCCVYFADKLGYVNVTLTEEEDKFKVDVESKEYEYHAKEFARKFK